MIVNCRNGGGWLGKGFSDKRRQGNTGRSENKTREDGKNVS